MRKLPLVVTAFTLAAGLVAGCSKNDSSSGASPSVKPSQAASTAPSASASASPSATPSPSAAPVTLKLFHGKQEAQDTFNEIIQKFSAKYPNIKVTQEVVTNDPSAVLKSRIATNEIPDIFSAGIEVMDIAKGGYMADLTNEPYLKNIVDTSLKSLSFTDASGKTWALPVDGSSIGIFYNKKMFADNGLTPPRTLSELKKVTDTFKSKNIPAFALGFKDSWTIKMAIISSFSPAVYGKNINWDTDKNAGKTTFEATPGWAAAFNNLKTIYDTGNTKTAFDTDYNGAVAMFAQGQAAMMPQGLWALEPIRKIAPTLDIGLIAMPTSEDPNDAKLHVFPDFSLSISSKSKYTAEAKKFLEFMTTPEIAQLWSNKARLFSAVKGVSTNFDPVAADVEKTIAAGQTVSQADRGWPSPFQPEFDKAISEFLLGKRNVPDSLKQLDTAWTNAAKAAK
ncbi:MAG: extracellular solute-binding protein [Paenibacillaceae bacterium]|nr:extracellular solute-binding protein [Paenibacillaceae bacterium]